MFSSSLHAIEKFIVDDEDLDDSILNSVFEGRLNQLNFTDSGDDYRLMGEEFSSLLTSIN